MPRSNEIKGLVEESAVLIDKLREYEKRIKEISVTKPDKILEKLQKQIESKDLIIRELADAKNTLAAELILKDKGIKNLKGELQSSLTTLDKAKKGVETLTQEIGRKDLVIKELSDRAESRNKTLKESKKDLDNKSAALIRFKKDLEEMDSKLFAVSNLADKRGVQLEKAAEYVNRLNSTFKEKNKESIMLREELKILDAANKKLIVKNNSLRLDTAKVNNILEERNILIASLQEGLSEKEGYYSELIEKEKKNYKNKLNSLLLNETKKELELRVMAKAVENRLKKQKQQFTSRTEKERELIEDLRVKLKGLEMSEIEDF